MDELGNTLSNGAKIYYVVPGLGLTITQTTVSLLIITVLLCLASYFLGRNLKKRPGGRQVLVEKGVAMLYGMVEETMGAHNLRFAPFIGTIFLSSICGSLIGLTGFIRSTTADLTVPLTWAVMVSAIIWYQSIKQNGLLAWLKGFTEPIFVMTPMNIISEIAQPLSMAFRHFGNVAGGGVISTILYTALALLSSAVIGLMKGHGVIGSCILLAIGAVLLLLARKKKKTGLKILGIASILVAVTGALDASGLLPGIPIFQYGIPAVLSCYFDLFSGFIQAYVFTLLTMVYIANACPPPEDAPQSGE